MEKQKLYPIIHNGKKMHKKDCDPLFVERYTRPEQLKEENSVFLKDSGLISIRICPDGKLLAR